jgi:beta-N-acetylhexosaminidase
MTSDFNPGLFTVLGFEGTVLDNEFLSLVEKFPPAGILLLGDNYESPSQLKTLVSRLKTAAGDRVVIAVDQEPGRVGRFKRGFPVSLKPCDYVDRNLESDFRNWCADTADLLMDTGINLNLAPVLDLATFSNPNPVLSDRVFGNDPETVSAFAGILIEEHKKRGILTCGKHFPGLGSAGFDPHVRLAESHESLDRFEGFYWQPFKAAVERDMDMIMTTHLLAETIDSHHAATYSRKTIDIIRNQIGFSGPVISDDLIMSGAGDPELIGEAALNSIRSGHNLIIISRHPDHQIETLNSIKNSYTQDHLFSKIANQNEKIIRQLQNRILF